MSAQSKIIDEILEAWFGPISADGTISEEAMRRWFTKDPAFDAALRERVGPLVEAAIAGRCDDWTKTPRGSVALVVLLDQLPRNIYRDTPRAFAGDARALEVARQALDSGQANDLVDIHRYILLMPFMHSEDREVQRESVERWGQAVEDAGSPKARKIFEMGLDYAKRHAVIVERFGRYPHRNAILGRASTPEEVEFLTQPGSSF